MTCQKCQSAPASVFVIEMVGRKVARKAHLCEACSEGGPAKSKQTSPGRGRLAIQWPAGAVNPYAVSAGKKTTVAKWKVGLN